MYNNFKWLVTEIDCETSRKAELLTLMKDVKHWSRNGYVEVQDPKTGASPLHVAAAKGYTDVGTIVIIFFWMLGIRDADWRYFMPT